MILCHGRIRRYLGIDPREVVASHSKGMETFPRFAREVLAWLDAHTDRFSPEFESCRRVADEHGVPLKAVYPSTNLGSLYPRPSPESGWISREVPSGIGSYIRWCGPGTRPGSSRSRRLR